MARPVALRWRITKALRAANMPPPSKLIVYTLADLADVETATIPDQHTPSLTELAAYTGLDRSTVTRRLNDLERDGWVIRLRPKPAAARLRGDRTRYRLALPPALALDAQGNQVGAEPNHVGAADNQAGSARQPPLVADDHTPSCTAQPKSQTRTEPYREDVEEVCAHLADAIAANGTPRPKITVAWRREARLLLDRDGKTVDQVRTAIDWCQADPFWHTNILSMPALRKQYRRLALQAKAERDRAGAPRHHAWSGYDDPSVYDQEL